MMTNDPITHASDCVSLYAQYLEGRADDLRLPSDLSESEKLLAFSRSLLSCADAIDSLALRLIELSKGVIS